MRKVGIIVSYGPEAVYRRKRCVGKYLISTGVAAIVLALCVGWLAHGAAAQIDGAPSDGPLTIRQCLSKARTSVAPVGQALIKDKVIEKNLLPTMVTNDMCEDILRRAPDGTEVQTLIVAQNYMQEIKLIENSIRGAAGEDTARSRDRHYFGDRSLISARTMVQANRSAAQQYHDGETPSGGGGNEMRETPSGGGANETRVRSIRRKSAGVSASAASVVTKDDASIAWMLNRIETAALKEGLSRPDAVRSARCGLEEALLNATSEELSHRDLIKVNFHQTPKVMEYGDTIKVKLRASGHIRELSENLEGQYEKVAKVSEAEEGCVGFTELMKAHLFDRRFTVDLRQGQETRPITRDTTWTWEVTANTEGKNSLDLFLGNVLKRGEMEMTPHWLEQSPVRHEVITVKVSPLREESKLAVRNWQWLLPIGIALAAAIWLVMMFRKRGQQRQRDTSGEG